MTTDYRAELQRLVEAIKNWDFDTGSLEQDWSALDRAEAALAKPEPVAPTDEELLELMPEEMRDDLAELSRMAAQHHGLKPGIFRVVLNTNVMAYARAVLARWGTHAIQPVPVSERHCVNTIEEVTND